MTRARTLCVDVGGSGIKALIVDWRGRPVTGRSRIPTPRPATPRAVLSALWKMVEPLGRFDRTSIGFPGVVVDGVTRSAPNLHGRWRGFPLAQQASRDTGKPVRALNDAGVQGFAVIDGKGVEMLLSLGTGMGCAVYLDGRYLPNLELAHHPFRHGDTYEEYIGRPALDRVGHKKWNKRVRRVIRQVDPIFNPRRLYLGGGNARHLTFELPPHVKIVQNRAGLLGGIALWRDPR